MEEENVALEVEMCEECCPFCEKDWGLCRCGEKVEEE